MSTEVENLVQRLEDLGVVVIAWSEVEVIDAHENQYGYPCSKDHAQDILISAADALRSRSVEVGLSELATFMGKEESEEE